MNHILNIPETMARQGKGKSRKMNEEEKCKEKDKRKNKKKKKRKEYLLNPTIKLLASKHITKTCL